MDVDRDNPFHGEPWLSDATLPEAIVRGWTLEQRRQRAEALRIDSTYPWADWILAEGTTDREARGVPATTPPQSAPLDGTPVSCEQMCAELIMLGDRGLAKVEPGDDDESRAFAREVIAANPDWEPGMIPLSPSSRTAFRPRARMRPERMPVRRSVARPREGRSTRRARSTRAGQGDDPGPGDEPPEPLAAAAGRVDDRGGSPFQRVWRHALDALSTPEEFHTLASHAEKRGTWLERLGWWRRAS